MALEECVVACLVIFLSFAGWWWYSRGRNSASVIDSNVLTVGSNVLNNGNNNNTSNRAMKSHYENAKIEILSGENINDLKKTYNAVKKAVFSIPPEYRERATSHPVWKIDLTYTRDTDKEIRIKQAQQHIMNIIKSDLHVETLPKKLTKKLESVFNVAKFQSIRSQKEEYCEIELSGDYGGESIVRIGIIGMQRLRGDREVLMHAALYFEKWVEQKHVKINKQHPIWNKENVKKFAKYLLIEEINGKIKAEKDKMMKTIQLENGTELYEWLQSINHTQYYHNFKQQGFEKKIIIAQIDKNTLTQTIKITLPGHVVDFQQKIKKLKHEIEREQKEKEQKKERVCANSQLDSR